MLEEIYNYLLLTESIATAGQPTKQQIAAIAESGYEVVINLGLADAEYALENEEAVVRAHGMQYIHLPVVWERPTKFDLEQFFKAMEANQNKKVFIHCAANMRVSAFMALYRILRLGWPEDKAFEQVQRIWIPNDTWQTFIDEILNQNDPDL
ncbi:MAG TPA: phosphatase [Anaerolineae bacterium]|nr:phosphatase [Anaerolineae bacterium]